MSLGRVLAQQEAAVLDAQIGHLGECKFLSEQEIVELAAKCKVGLCWHLVGGCTYGLAACRRAAVGLGSRLACGFLARILKTVCVDSLPCRHVPMIASLTRGMHAACKESRMQW